MQTDVSCFNDYDLDQDEVQLLYMGFRATLNFPKFKMALNPMYRIF